MLNFRILYMMNVEYFYQVCFVNFLFSTKKYTIFNYWYFYVKLKYFQVDFVFIVYPIVSRVTIQFNSRGGSRICG